MRQRKYTLPRHTNIAPQGSRIGAFLVDVAIFFAITLGLIYGCFKFVFAFKTTPLEKSIREERISSHLFFEVEGGGFDYYSKDSDNKEFIEALEYFYTVYIPSKNSDLTEELTPEWFNKNVLNVEGDGGAYFEYVKVGEEVDKTQFALIKEDALAIEVNKYLYDSNLDSNFINSDEFKEEQERCIKENRKRMSQFDEDIFNWLIDNNYVIEV